MPIDELACNSLAIQIVALQAEPPAVSATHTVT